MKTPFRTVLSSPLRFLLLGLSLAIIASGARLACAADATAPVQGVETALKQARPVFENQKLPASRRRRELHAIAKQHFDFPYMARESLGVHWRTLTPAQRAQYVPLFTDFVIDSFLAILQQSTVHAVSHSLTGTATITSPGYAEVHSLVKLPSLSQPLKVDYRMHRENAGWKIYDITIDGVSQMASYRNDFNSVINQSGYPALVTDLKDKRVPMAH
ncbi:MAG: MlaC/ttg2D family ABC transporter substrate-binding protein [Candidatus Binataceae bacterium]